MAILLLPGCASDAGSPATAPTEDELRGGTLAPAAKYDAVGILGHLGIAGDVLTTCTGTLIDSKHVITAKHCVRDDAEGTDNRIEEGLWFYIGSNASSPRLNAKVLSAKVPAAIDGGYIGYGSDVAVLTLEQDIKGVTPAKVAPTELTSLMIGKKLSIVGFGFNSREVDGVRRIGPVTLRGVSGKPLTTIFGTLPKFTAFAVKAEKDKTVADSDDSRLGMLTYAFGYELVPHEEAFVGLASGDAQPCRNDSGAPILLEEAGTLTVWAVASGSLKLSDKSCGNYGSFVATFGPAVRPILP